MLKSTDMFRYLILSLITIWIVACQNDGKPGGSGNAPYDLKLQLKTGDHFRYEMSTIQRMNQTLMGKKMNIDQEMLFVFDYDVLLSNGQSTDMKVTYHRIRMKQKSDAGTVELDTDSAELSNPVYKDLLKLKGKSFQISVNSKGEITKLSGMEFLGGNSMSDSSLKSMLEMSFKLYPDHPVKPGDQWNIEMTNDLGGVMKMKLNNTYELIQVEKELAEIKCQSSISSEKGNTQQMEMELSGTQEGTMQMELGTGMVRSLKMKQKMSGRLKASNMDIPMEIESDVELKGSKR
jgi:hypothetical protein